MSFRALHIFIFQYAQMHLLMKAQICHADFKEKASNTHH